MIVYIKRLLTIFAGIVFVSVPILSTVPVSATPTTNSLPEGITSGPDGNMWFTERATGNVGKATPSGTITEYSVGLHSNPADITIGPDGALWFTEHQAIGRITTSGTITTYSLPTNYVSSGTIALGADGNLWFTGNYDLTGEAYVGRITPSGTVTEYVVGYYEIGGMASSSDGYLWFTNNGNGSSAYLGRIDPAGVSVDATVYSLPADTYPNYITAGADGNLWFTEDGSGESNGSIAKLATASSTITQYPLPTGYTYPTGIASGPDGALWFTEQNSDQIGRITTSGTITNEYSVPTSEAGPYEITTGPDNNLWFTEADASQIGQLILVTAPGAPTDLTASSPTSSSPSLSWTASSGATSYNVYRNGTDISSSTTTSYTDSSAPQGTNSYYITAVNSSGESGDSNTANVAYDSTLPQITNFTANNGSTFSRQNTPYYSGVATQTINSDGSVTVSVNSAPGYADSGFYLYNGPLSGLPSFTANSSSGEFGLNLWFDNANLGDFFQWNSSGTMTGLGGDTYGLSLGSSSGTLSVGSSTSFFMMNNGQNYTLAQLKAGDDSAVSPSSNVSVWIGVDVGSGGSTSATISSITGL